MKICFNKKDAASQAGVSADPVPVEGPAKQLTVGEDNSIAVTDKRGRSIVVRRMSVIERLRSKKVIGGVNEDYYYEALPAFMVVSIDSAAVLKPTNELTLEGLISRLGDDGLEAILPACMKLLFGPGKVEVDEAKNSQGTSI